MPVQPYERALISLRKRWWIYFACAVGMLAGGYLFLSVRWDDGLALRWLGMAAVVCCYIAGIVWFSLKDNVRQDDYGTENAVLLPYLGAGNLVTLGRGLMIAALYGFLLVPRPPGWLAWIPGLLYLFMALLDIFDGMLARRLNQATLLGKNLDIDFDGLGMLAAVTLIVSYGQVPTWYLLVGLARYLFLLGIKIRQYLGLPVYALPPRPSRRLFGALQIGFVAVMLLPLFNPPGTHLAAWLLGLPFLVNFTLDWLAVSGVTVASSKPSVALLQRFIFTWLPVLLRLGILLLMGEIVFDWKFDFTGRSEQMAASGYSLPLAWILAWAEALVLLLIVCGVAGRIVAIAGLCLLVLSLNNSSVFIPHILLGVCLTGVLHLGNGVLSLWKPEDILLSPRKNEIPPDGSTQKLM